MANANDLILAPDVVANRPAAGRRGRFFFATDRGVIYRDNGSAWVEWPYDANYVTYTPGVLADWDYSSDPGDVQEALDQLASRVADEEAGGGAGGGTTNHAIVQGRLTLETGVAISTSDQSAKATLYFTPHGGNLIGTYTDAAWQLQTFTEKSLSLAALTADKNYDIFIEDSDLSLSAVIWTNDTTRATALTTQDGVLVKSGDVSKRYLGTIRVNSTGGQCEDTVSQRFLWNYYNQVPRVMRVVEATNTWDYATATWRSANNSAANRVEYVCGVSDNLIESNIFMHVSSASGLSVGVVGVGVDSTSANSAQIYVEAVAVSSTPVRTMSMANYIGYPGLGYHYIQWIEYCRSGTARFEAITAAEQCGMFAGISG